MLARALTRAERRLRREKMLNTQNGGQMVSVSPPVDLQSNIPTTFTDCSALKREQTESVFVFSEATALTPMGRDRDEPFLRATVTKEGAGTVDF